MSKIDKVIYGVGFLTVTSWGLQCLGMAFICSCEFMEKLKLAKNRWKGRKLIKWHNEQFIGSVELDEYLKSDVPLGTTFHSPEKTMSVGIYSTGLHIKTEDYEKYLYMDGNTYIFRCLKSGKKEAWDREGNSMYISPEWGEYSRDHSRGHCNF